MCASLEGRDYRPQPQSTSRQNLSLRLRKRSRFLRSPAVSVVCRALSPSRAAYALPCSIRNSSWRRMPACDTGRPLDLLESDRLSPSRCLLPIGSSTSDLTRSPRCRLASDRSRAASRMPCLTRNSSWRPRLACRIRGFAEPGLDPNPSTRLRLRMRDLAYRRSLRSSRLSRGDFH